MPGEPSRVAGACPPALRPRVAVVLGADPGTSSSPCRRAAGLVLGPATALAEPRSGRCRRCSPRSICVCLDTVDVRVASAPVLNRVPGCA